MAATWWKYPTRRFSVDGLEFAVRTFAKTDGLHSTLEMLGVEKAGDQTPLVGPEAVRNHRLSCSLPDGRILDVELGYIGAWTTGIIVRIGGNIVYESHPGKTPTYPEKYRAAVISKGDMKPGQGEGRTGQPGPFSSGVFAKHNRLPFAIDVATGLLFYAVAKTFDLSTAALLGVAIGFALILFQRITKIDVTGGLAIFGIVMLTISAGLALVFNDDEWIKLRGTITGLIAASFFIIDGWRGGPYIGRGLTRYVPYSDIDPGRFALGMGVVGFLMAGLNYAVAKLFSTDIWLFYSTFVDFLIVMVLVTVVMVLQCLK
jgi:intracellular septation protein A